MSHRLSYVPWSWSLLLLHGLGCRLLGCSLCRWLLSRSRFGGGLLGGCGFLLRRSLPCRWLLRRLRLGLGFIGLRLLGLDLLRLRARNLGLQRLLAVGEDLGGGEQSQILAMPLLAARTRDSDELVASRLLQHLVVDQLAGNDRATRLRAIAAKQQHFAERNDVAGLARDALDLDNVVRRHAILLAARADDREHVSLSSLTLGLESRPCLGRLGRGPEKMAGSEA